MATVVIKITERASYKDLKGEVRKEAKARNIADRKLAHKVLTFALAHRGKYTSPLANYSEGGESFDCNCTTDERVELRAWAKNSSRALGAHCAYLIAKTIENGDLKSI